MREIILPTGCSRTYNNKIVHNYQNTDCIFVQSVYLFLKCYKKSVKKNLTNIETWCIICLNQRKTFSRAFDFDRKGNYNSCKTERVITMCQKQIKLNAKEDVQEFARAGKCDFDIDVFYNRIIIDAKSILGVLSMDLTRVLTVQCHGESKEFNRTLQKFAVA